MITVVVPLYNKEKSVRATLESVRAQSYKDWECIVVDDGSTDKSREVAEQFMIDDLRFKILTKSNGGVCSARNKGIEEAKGEYIALLDGDDVWDKEYLAEQVKMIEDFPEAAMWGINYAETNNGVLVRTLSTGLPDGYRGYVENYFHIKNRSSDLFCSSSVVISREVFEKVGLFDERIKYAEDSDMWFRIIATYRVAFYDRYMVYYRFEAENRAQNNVRPLSQFLPYYVDKYQTLLYKQNQVFYRWVNHWSAIHIKRYYFSENVRNREDACAAVKKLDYSVIPLKYRLFYKLPYRIASIIYTYDQKRKS